MNIIKHEQSHQAPVAGHVHRWHSLYYSMGQLFRTLAYFRAHFMVPEVDASHQCLNHR